MRWTHIVGYRLRFNAERQKGDVRKHVAFRGGQPTIDTLVDVDAMEFAAVTLVLEHTIGHHPVAYGKWIDGGPQWPSFMFPQLERRER